MVARAIVSASTSVMLTAGLKSGAMRAMHGVRSIRRLAIADVLY